VWPLLTFAMLLVFGFTLAALAVRRWGKTRQSRQTIFTVVAFVGLVVAAAIMFARLRALS
jgi:hypothetical protein